MIGSCKPVIFAADRVLQIGSSLDAPESFGSVRLQRLHLFSSNQRSKKTKPHSEKFGSFIVRKKTDSRNGCSRVSELYHGSAFFLSVTHVFQSNHLRCCRA